MLMSCSQRPLVEKKFSFSEGIWVNGEKRSITFEAPDTSSLYEMELEIQHASDYAYQNLYVLIATTFPSGKQDSSITSLELSDTGAGWSGDCMGDRCSVRLPLLTTFKFPEKGLYSWSIEPYMRIDTIKGIRELEVELKESI